MSPLSICHLIIYYIAAYIATLPFKKFLIFGDRNKRLKFSVQLLFYYLTFDFINLLPL